MREHHTKEDKRERRKKTQIGGIGSPLPGYLCEKGTRKGRQAQVSHGHTKWWDWLPFTWIFMQERKDAPQSNLKN